MEDAENVVLDPNKFKRLSCKYTLKSLKQEMGNDGLPLEADCSSSKTATRPPLAFLPGFLNLFSRKRMNSPINFETEASSHSSLTSLNNHFVYEPPTEAGHQKYRSKLRASNSEHQKLLKVHRFHSVRVHVNSNDIQRFLNNCRKLRSRDSSYQSSLSVDSKVSLTTDNEQQVYEVEKVLAIRKIGRVSCEYLLKWKGYNYKVSSWEKNVSSCAELVRDYQNRDRSLRFILDMLQSREYPYFYNRFYDSSFYHCHEWEDELMAICSRAGQGPIYVENWVDLNCRQRKKFTFITENKISDGARALFCEPKHLTFCKCDSHLCGSIKECCPDIFGMKYPYTSSGRVRQKFDVRSEWLVECTDGCACGTDCPTRVVQRGRQIPIVIFRTVDRGWSIRTLVNIKANTFVMEYIGEVITIEHAKRYRLATYQFEMDACDECAFVVDALNYGNEARFVNHSCDPNMVVRGVFSDRYDMRYHRIAYFAMRDISKGEELTINYFSKHSDDEFKQLTKKKSNKSCFCKAKKCRGFFI